MKEAGKYGMAKIVAFAILKSFLMLYILHLHPHNSIGFWRLLLGGLQVGESKFIFFVVIQILPDFLFYHSVGSRYIRQLKANYVYIFVRERNMKCFVRKSALVSLFDILLYEAMEVILLFLVGMGLRENMVIQPDRFAVLLLYQFVKLSFLVIFCNMLILKFHELVAVYANLVLLALPLFLVGVLYDMGGAWEAAVKYIPFNWCNYNYILETQLNPALMLCLSAAVGVLLYWYMEKLFHTYEVV